MFEADSDNTGKQKPSKWGFRLWLSALFLTVLIFVVLGTAMTVRHATFAALNDSKLMSADQANIVMSVAEFPSLVRDVVSELLRNTNTELMIDRKTAEKPGWVRRFPAPEDTGYLLFSGLDPKTKHSIVSLIRISDGKEMARWDPDWAMIYKFLTDKKLNKKGSVRVARAMHPVLLSDGAIVFNTNPSSGMVRMNLCDSKPVWVLDEFTHHSNEIGIDGAIWTPAVAQDGFPDNAWLANHVRDDALARVSIDGDLLEKHSFVRILRENGLMVMLLGVSGNRRNYDLIHMNQISVAPSDSRYWKRGDLLISTRHTSAVFLYRPSIRRIIWHRQGPWMNQHSARFVDDHRISVFDNNIFARDVKQHEFLSAGDTNRIFVYDFEKDQVSQPFEALLAEAKPMTISEGLARILPDGGLFVEETNFGRHLRFTKDRLLWSRVNDFDDEHIGMVSWSRYLTAEEARMPLRAIEKHPCQNDSMTTRAFGPGHPALAEAYRAVGQPRRTTNRSP